MGLLTDDCDLNQNQLETEVGGNGDYYITIKANKAAYSVRIATSGGIAPIGVRLAIANLHRQMEAAGLNSSNSKNELCVGGVSESVCSLPDGCSYGDLSKRICETCKFNKQTVC